jgi:hypothetical protein
LLLDPLDALNLAFGRRSRSTCVQTAGILKESLSLHGLSQKTPPRTPSM